jgi:hypothetical protein
MAVGACFYAWVDSAKPASVSSPSEVSCLLIVDLFKVLVQENQIYTAIFSYSMRLEILVAHFIQDNKIKVG